MGVKYYFIYEFFKWQFYCFEKIVNESLYFDCSFYDGRLTLAFAVGKYAFAFHRKYPIE